MLGAGHGGETMNGRVPGKVRNMAGRAAAVLRRAGMLLCGVMPVFFARVGDGVAALWRRILALPASKKSLRLRLSVFFSLFMLAAWLAAAFFTWQICRGYIDEFFDSQQMVVAKTLSVADIAAEPGNIPKLKDMLPKVDKRAVGRLEDEAIGFAVFSSDGKRLLTDGKKGRRFVFEGSRRGFVNAPLHDDDDVWRILWLPSADGRKVIAVGQELDYRRDMALEMLAGQILPWLVLLPVLLAGLFILLTRELAPLRAMASELQARRPEDSSPLDTMRLPLEVLPMADALNGFFARTKAMLTRERSFLSDAAHELRTPLAGLRIQAQVAAQPGMDEETRREALSFLRQGIDRCSRLMEQLLALSRLEASAVPFRPESSSGETVNWASLLEEYLPSYRARLEANGIRLESQLATLNAAVPGNSGLLSMLLRNILENAAAYTPEGGLIRVSLERGSLAVQNDCRPLPEEYVARLGERFFRPPGQDKAGSGLGISIVMRIAALHGFRLDIRTEKNAPGFSSSSFLVRLNWTER